MRYDGPPGLMLDLVPASPDGVDLEWIHPYTYVNNNPVVATDPSGLEPAGGTPKGPARPPRSPSTPWPVPRPTIPVETYCGVTICCGPLVDPTTGLTVRCCPPLSPPNLIGQVPCHCFVRFTEIETGPGGAVFTFTDYHGWGVGGVLTAVMGQYTSWVPNATCTSLGTTTGAKACAKIAKCLTDQMALCNNTPVPYMGCFGTANSNTAAYQFATCAPGGAPAGDPAMGVAGCPLGAIGYGPGPWAPAPKKKPRKR
jgi:hypothetical protein